MFCIDYVRFPVKQVLNYPIAILDWDTWTNVTQIAVILEMTKNINSIPSSILVNLINLQNLAIFDIQTWKFHSNNKTEIIVQVCNIYYVLGYCDKEDRKNLAYINFFI